MKGKKQMAGKLKGLVTRNKTSYVDPLEDATNKSAGALNLFADVHDQLEEANGTLEAVKADSERSIAFHEDRVSQARSRVEQNRKVQDKLKDFFV